ncbi:hypothetical protein ACIGO8_07610 [Streptomyces sp. NPDC053493]|uniref:hypothetical protein n=1 Tax=Streptomyces sp. NPDC053493 TaxID=3365705 RepID=UPI0037D06853
MRKRAKAKPLALVIGGLMVVGVGGAVVGQRLGNGPGADTPLVVATPSSSAPAGSSAAPGAPDATTPPAAGEATTPGVSHPPTTAPARGESPGQGTGTTAPPPPTRRPTRSAPPSPAPAGVLALRSADVQEYCANGEWPNKVVVVNTGGGALDRTAGALPAGVTLSRSGGSLAASAVAEIELSGRIEQMPGNGLFTIGFTSNGGSAEVIVHCS